MFPRAKRLTRAAFTARGTRVSSKHFSMTLPSGPGYAVVVSKAVAKSSVVRHRLKRQVFAVLEHGTLPSGLVVYARSGAQTLSFRDIEHEIVGLIAHMR